MISWGFLGAGWIAKTAFAPAVHAASNATLQAVASRDHDRAKALGPHTVYDSYEDLLADPAIDAVYINLANDQHCHWSIAAMAAGKHVLCEKPIALDYAQAQLMADAAKKYDRVVVEAVWSQWHPRFIRAIELVQAGEIGDLTSIDSSFCFTGDFADNYRLDPTMGGGSLLDVGVYQAHAWAALNPGALDLQISSLAENLSDSGVDLTTKIAGLLGGVVKVDAIASFEMPVQQHLVITGDHGSIEFLGNEAFTSWHKESALQIGDQVHQFAAVDPYQLMIENFGEHIMGRESWIMPMEQSLAVMKVVDQIKAFNSREGKLE
jgi:predicted dehydrogenase